MRIYVAGLRVMVGVAIKHQLEERRRNGGPIETIVQTSAELEFTNQSAVHEFLQAELPDAVILAGAEVGGPHANNALPANFIYDSLMMEANVIHQTLAASVTRLLFSANRESIPRMRPSR